MDLTLYQLRVIGFNALAKKLIKRVLSKSRRKKNRDRDFANPTYSDYLPDDFTIQNRIIDASEIVRHIANPEHYFGETSSELHNYYAHCYTLLSADALCRNRLQDQTSGSQLVNKSNMEESQRIAKLIGDGYNFINWQADATSGKEWNPTTQSADIGYGKNGADIKVPWELGRFQHIIPLALLSVHVSMENSVFVEFCNQFLDFAASNPPRYGVQWKCTMDVALRAFSLLVCNDSFAQAGFAMTTDILNVFRRSIFEHGIHIRTHLEWGEGSRGNHYLANLLGLIAIGVYSSGADSEEWLSFASAELCNEILYQFNPDGSNFEASTNYHVFALEMILWALYLLRSDGNRSRITTDAIARIKKAMLFTYSIISPNGAIPQIGDNDGGMVFPLTRSVADKRSVFGLYSLLTGDYSHGLSENTSNRIECFYPELIVDFKEYRTNCLNRITSFNDFGAYVYRSDRYMSTLRCGSVGQRGKGGHAHCDQLSFTLSVDGVEVISDPGTYCYTSDWEARNRFRSSSAHSTITIPGKEQMPFGAKSTDDLFWVKDNKTKADIEIVEFDKLISEHCGYGSKVTREVKYLENKLIIEDRSLAGGFTSQFVLSPGVRAEMGENHAVIITYNDKILTLNSKHGLPAILSCEYSIGYGIITSTILITFLCSEASNIIEISL